MNLVFCYNCGYQFPDTELEFVPAGQFGFGGYYVCPCCGSEDWTYDRDR